MVSYDPVLEADLYFEEQEKAWNKYVEENECDQIRELDIWMESFIKEWNPRYKVNGWAESILLCIYICNKFYGSWLMKIKTKGDSVYSLLDSFPKVDAIENNFIDDLSEEVNTLKQHLEEID